MQLSDAVAGALRPGQSITWTRAPDPLDTTIGVPEDLTGATITGTLRDLTTGLTRAIVGALNVADALNGVFTWAYDVADNVEGVYFVTFNAAFAVGITPAKSFVSTWVVHAEI